MMNFSFGREVPTSMIFHPIKSLIAVGVAQTGQLTVWDWRTKTYLLEQESCEVRISAYDFSPSCSTIILGDFKGNLKLIDMKSNFNTVSFGEAAGKITGVKFFNEKTFAASSLDGVVRVYDLIK